MKYINPVCTNECLKKIVNGRLQCTCGETTEIFMWSWTQASNTSNIQLSNHGKDILFHPVYSTGTAAIRGEKSFKPNFIYYWEVKILSDLQGTSVMVGVGTSNISLTDWKFRFGCLIGTNSESWGYCHRGFVQHNDFIRNYGSEFGIGNLVGIFLNMFNGTLEFYINRKPQGIAFTGLKSYDLYPMCSSTCAKSAIRTICAVSEEDTLQLKCLEIICKSPILYKKYQQVPGLTRLYKRRYFWVVPESDYGSSQSSSEGTPNFSLAGIKNIQKMHHW